MRNLIQPVVLLAAALLPAATVLAAPKSGTTLAERWSMLDTYCGKCHNSTDWAGGLAFDTMSPKDVPHDIDVWEATVRKLRGNLMPPPGEKQPTQTQRDELVGWLETSLDARRETPRAGHVAAQRLSRDEYANAVRSLLGVEVKAADMLPPEIELEGFDNIAASLTTSPAFLDQYISAARYISARAVGSAAPKMGKATYGNQPGGTMPLGAGRGVRFKHYFPADGEYHFSVVNDMTGSSANSTPSLFRQTVVMFLDGKEVFRGYFGGKEDLGLADKEGVAGGAKVMARFRNIPVKVTFGMHEIVFTTMERAQVLSDANTGGGFGGAGGGPSSVEVTGPYGEVGFSAGTTRDRIFICNASTEPEEKPCAEKIARHLATQAYRRPVTDADVQRLMGFYATGRKEIGNFVGGVQEVVMAVIASPEFLYRSIQPKDQKRARPLTALELASRLSFFLWSDVPDDELRQVAISGKLTRPAVFEKQVKRMLADKRAAALVTNFAMRWLNVDDLDAVKPDPELYRGFNNGLRDDFTTEMQLFLSEVLLDNRSVLELLSADYTYLNNRLAQHYGVRGVQGATFRRVQLTDANRFGLLGKGAVLLRTSYPDRTSPVLRGAWVLEKLLNTMTSPPPPGVETNLTAAEGAKPTTLRGRLEQHRAAKSCSQCHGVIDPIGLAMENFDVIGAYRTRDNGIEVDASTVLPNGVAINGAAQLREALLARPDQFVQTMVQKLLMYGTGREVEAADMPQVRQIVRNVKPAGYHFFDLVMGVVKSDAFRLQAPAPVEPAGKEIKKTVAAAQ